MITKGGTAERNLEIIGRRERKRKATENGERNRANRMAGRTKE